MLYRQEHPKPQFMRKSWVNLNGEWDFQIDFSNSGTDRKIFETEEGFDRKINVPFCPESKLSGIEFKDFMQAVWYKRKFNISKEQAKGRIVLHFGAVDYCAIVYINGKKVGTHKGGYVSFFFDITELVVEGENTIIVNAQDDIHNRLVPRGKQSELYYSHSCDYTRTTGIWQTVWLEFTPKDYIESVRYTTDINTPSVTLYTKLKGEGTLSAEVYYEGQLMGSGSAFSAGDDTVLNIALKEKHLWELGCGRLYTVKLSFGDDLVESYFGLRTISYRNRKFYLNGKSVFQRLVLDQGFYPEGIYTAPTDSELEADIDRAMAMGFNGARLHEKVFEERFLYHADRKGYIVWGEYPNWGLDISYEDSIYGILPEWLEEVERDINHPSIVGWCPLNETGGFNNRKQFDGVLELLYKATKMADPSRPCIDTSGYIHVVTDVFDLHDYEEDPEVLRSHYENLGTNGEVYDYFDTVMKRQKYDGKLPFFISEYGGIGWSVNNTGWGYGNVPKTREEFLKRLKGINDVLLDNEYIFGFCYTQLTDIEQEQNGLYTYDRVPKFPPEEIYPLFARKAAIEE